MQHSSPVQIFHQYLPSASIPYCLDLWKRYPFELKLRNPRATKVGDYCARHGRKAVITINKDLYPFLFLVTYIHEFSHHAVNIVYGNLPDAHGKEWKLAFKTFMGPVMDMNLFPPDLQAGLVRHLKNPKASSFSDPLLTSLFRKHDPQSQNHLLLSHIKEGNVFLLNGKHFRKGPLQRTRILCVEIKTGKKYLVPKDAEVDDLPVSA